MKELDPAAKTGWPSRQVAVHQGINASGRTSPRSLVIQFNGGPGGCLGGNLRIVFPDVYRTRAPYTGWWCVALVFLPRGELGVFAVGHPAAVLGRSCRERLAGSCSPARQPARWPRRWRIRQGMYGPATRRRPHERHGASEANSPTASPRSATVTAAALRLSTQRALHEVCRSGSRGPSVLSASQWVEHDRVLGGDGSNCYHGGEPLSVFVPVPRCGRRRVASSGPC